MRGKGREVEEGWGAQGQCEPWIMNRDLRTVNCESWTVNREPLTANRELRTANREPWIANREPWTLNRETWTAYHEPWTANREPGIVNREQRIVNRERRIVYREPRIGNHEPRTMNTDFELTSLPLLTPPFACVPTLSACPCVPSLPPIFLWPQALDLPFLYPVPVSLSLSGSAVAQW